MPRSKSQNPKANATSATIGFEAQLWAATEQAVPAPHYAITENNGARPEGLCHSLIFLKYISEAFKETREQLLFGFSDPKSEWFIKDEPQRKEAAENRDVTLSASNGERAGVRCRNHRINQRTICSVRGQRWLCASTTTWKLARMNLANRGIDANLGPRNADSFRADLHPDLKADFVPVRKDLANPPFNMCDWGGENLRQDVRWKSGMPPVNNANYAWIQHFIRHLSPVGVAGFVMANGSMSTQTSNEGEIRKVSIEADRVDCMVALPGRLSLKQSEPTTYERNPNS